MKPREYLAWLLLAGTAVLADKHGGKGQAHAARHKYLPYKGPGSSHKHASNSLPTPHASGRPSVHEGLTTGRYGHSAVYLPGSHQVLFIGGQVGEKGSRITNDVLVLDLKSKAPSTSNPKLDAAYSKNLIPHAWAASGVDDRQQVWLIGGVTEDCKTDPLALYYCPQKSEWLTAPTLPRAPPRRRQALATALVGSNKTTSLYVWGGIAEPYTCSAETVAYMGMDIWGTAPDGSISTVGFSRPPQAPSDFMPTVSDYATVAWAEGQIVILGGQRADGTLSSMSQIMVFESKTNSWQLKNANTTGNCPTPRMGLVAFPISDTQLLIHGGVGQETLPEDDVWLLNGAPNGAWGWSKVELSKHSLRPPHRAWHTATVINDNLIVIAYGIDTESTKSSNDVFYLARESDNTWTWSTTWVPQAAVKPHVSSKAKPKAKSTVAPAPPASTAPPPYGAGYITGVTALAVPSSVLSMVSSTMTPLSSYQDTAQPAQGSSSTGAAVGGTIGGVVGAAALAGLVGLWLRRRGAASRHADVISSEPVSTMHFTRPPPMRVLSLGRSAQVRPPLADRSMPPSQMRATVNQDELLDFLYPSGKARTVTGVGMPPGEATAQDPFADRYAQQQGYEEEEGAESVPPSVTGSVQSYPYLTALPMSAENSDTSARSDAATINANTHTSLGWGRPGTGMRNIQDDHLTRLPDPFRHSSAPRAASSPVGPSRIRAGAPSSPYVMGTTAGLLRVTNPPSTPDRSFLR